MWFNDFLWPNYSSTNVTVINAKRQPNDRKSLLVARCWKSSPSRNCMMRVIADGVLTHIKQMYVTTMRVLETLFTRGQIATLQTSPEWERIWQNGSLLSKSCLSFSRSMDIVSWHKSNWHYKRKNRSVKERWRTTWKLCKTHSKA